MNTLVPSPLCIFSLPCASSLFLVHLPSPLCIFPLPCINIGIGVIQQRTNTTVNQIYSAINPDDQLDTIERLFAYLWDLQANNNAVSSAQDSFYINWNIENIWLKWETNTEKLPEHISQILPSNENGGDQSNILYIVAKHLADPILLYLSGPYFSQNLGIL